MTRTIEMPWLRKNKQPKSEEERLVELIGSGPWKAGFTIETPPMMNYLYDKARYVVPVPADKLNAAVEAAINAFATLPENLRERMTVKVVKDREVERTYGKGIYVVVLEETDYHNILDQADDLGKNMMEAGRKLFESYAPDNIKKAFRILVLKRGREDAVGF